MTTWLEHFGRDLRFGIRGLMRSRGFTALAVLSLALGIMATTAIYSVVHAVVIDPFPYKDVGNLMSVRVSSPVQSGSRTGYSVDQFLEIAERSTIFDGVIASTISDVLWTGEGDPQRLRGNPGTFNTFDVMGVPPLLGRTPVASDAAPGAEPVVVLGYRFWQAQLGGDPGVLGRRLRLNDTTRTVIGVMPKRFMWRGADVYLPVTLQRGRVAEGVRGVHLLGRLKSGVTAAQAEADLRADHRRPEAAGAVITCLTEADLLAIEVGAPGLSLIVADRERRREAALLAHGLPRHGAAAAHPVSGAWPHGRLGLDDEASRALTSGRGLGRATCGGLAAPCRVLKHDDQDRDRRSCQIGPDPREYEAQPAGDEERSLPVGRGGDESPCPPANSAIPSEAVTKLQMMVGQSPIISSAGS